MRSSPIAVPVAADLAAKVAALRRPAIYPEPTLRVDAVETHMSWVFLTDRFAYKLKKPVWLPFLDFSTVERRKHFCEEEIRLNRRLAPEVYVGTVPMTLDSRRPLALAGDGPVVDWLVKMHRLPVERMLDHAVRHGTVGANDVDHLANRLARFYRTAKPVSIAAPDYRRRFENDIAENRHELQAYADGVSGRQVERVHSAQLAFLAAAPELFDRRVDEGRIVEAHGDLRPEHVALGAEPQIIDCLEFNREFRTLDPVDELAFFMVECEVLGAPAVGGVVFDRYCAVTGDLPPSRLLDFYRSYRAGLRAKITIWHLRETPVRDPGRWPPLARRYLDLADRYAVRLRVA